MRSSAAPATRKSTSSMKELRQAMNEFLREFAERAQKNPNLADQMQPRPGVAPERHRQADGPDREPGQVGQSRAGAGTAFAAREDDEQSAGRPQQQQQGQNGQQGEMRKQMDKLGEIMRRQQEMMNETFRMDQMQRGQRQRGQDRDEQLGEQNGRPARPGAAEQGKARACRPRNLPSDEAAAGGPGQAAQRPAGLMKGLEGLGIQPGEGFGEAGEAMGEAETALGEGQGDEAVGQQGRALEALRKGAQDMMQQMQQAMQGDEGGSEEGGRAAGCGPRSARPAARHDGARRGQLGARCRTRSTCSARARSSKRSASGSAIR